MSLKVKGIFKKGGSTVGLNVEQHIKKVQLGLIAERRHYVALCFFDASIPVKGSNVG